MGRAQSDTYSSLFTKSDNVNLDETFDRNSALVHVLIHSLHYCHQIIERWKRHHHASYLYSFSLSTALRQNIMTCFF